MLLTQSYLLSCITIFTNKKANTIILAFLYNIFVFKIAATCIYKIFTIEKAKTAKDIFNIKVSIICIVTIATLVLLFLQAQKQKLV